MKWILIRDLAKRLGADPSNLHKRIKRDKPRTKYMPGVAPGRGVRQMRAVAWSYGKRLIDEKEKALSLTA